MESESSIVFFYEFVLLRGWMVLMTCLLDELGDGMGMGRGREA